MAPLFTTLNKTTGYVYCVPKARSLLHPPDLEWVIQIKVSHIPLVYFSLTLYNLDFPKSNERLFLKPPGKSPELQVQWLFLGPHSLALWIPTSMKHHLS
jgi:hypothetical protein